jgi:hypothetical protein
MPGDHNIVSSGRCFYMFQSVAGIRWRVPEMTIGSLRKAGWGICRITHTAQDNLSCSTGLEIEGQALQPYVSRRHGEPCRKRAKQAASALVYGKEVTLQTHASTNTSAPLPMCSCLMAPTPITRWSKRAGVGGIGSTRRGTCFLRNWKSEHERPG